jgi:hypothetical protein
MKTKATKDYVSTWETAKGNGLARYGPIGRGLLTCTDPLCWESIRVYIAGKVVLCVHELSFDLYKNPWNEMGPRESLEVRHGGNEVRRRRRHHHRRLHLQLL